MDVFWEDWKESEYALNENKRASLHDMFDNSGAPICHTTDQN